MRTLCPNLGREDGLDTVLEVPIPEEMFPATKSKWPNINMMKSWMAKPVPGRSTSPNSGNQYPFADRSSQLQLLLGVIGAPLIPLPIPQSSNSSHLLEDHPIEASMAKYIVHQYIAAMGGEHALKSIDSMYAMGKVRMTASEFSAGGGGRERRRRQQGGEGERRRSTAAKSERSCCGRGGRICGDEEEDEESDDGEGSWVELDSDDEGDLD